MTNIASEDTSKAYWSFITVDSYKVSGKRSAIMIDYFTSFWSLFLTRDFSDALIEGE
jgi:hypothetical protein